MSLTLSFKSIVPNEYVQILAAIWVSTGADRCIVGYCGAKYKGAFQQMNGRLGQVIDIFSRSESKTKNDYSEAHNGVMLIAIIDRSDPGDELLNGYLSHDDSSDSSNKV